MFLPFCLISFQFITYSTWHPGMECFPNSLDLFHTLISLRDHRTSLRWSGPFGEINKPSVCWILNRPIVYSELSLETSRSKNTSAAEEFFVQL